VRAMRKYGEGRTDRESEREHIEQAKEEGFYCVESRTNVGRRANENIILCQNKILDLRVH